MRFWGRAAEDWARWRTLSGAVAVALATCLSLALALGGPAWLKIAAAAITAVSAVSAVVFYVAETRATPRKTGRLGELHGVPPLPSEFVERQEFEALRRVLVEGGDEAVGIAGPVGIQGKGGIGKTMLAAALASDEAGCGHASRTTCFGSRWGSGPI